MRLDQWLVENNLAPSRTKAKELIETDSVEVDKGRGFCAAKSASQKMLGTDVARVINPELLKYVSRSGHKLEKALKHTLINVNGWNALDMGVSTGGFTDCLIQHGAQLVVGVDVGTDQVAEKIKQQKNVRIFENINGKEILKNHEILSFAPFDIAVMDVSFISMVQLLPALVATLKPHGTLLALVKPQFEVGNAGVNKKGIVVDKALFKGVEEKIRTGCEKNSIRVVDYFDSGYPGRDGNQEFFVYGVKEK